MVLPEFDCRTCKPAQQLNRGCEKNARQPLILDGVSLMRCPRRPILEEPELWAALIKAMNAAELGVYPEDGGLMSQPARLMESLDVMQAAQAEGRKIQDERRKRES